MDDAPPPPTPLDPSMSGPLTRPSALALLERGGGLLASGDFADAGALFSRVVGFDDPAITAAALLGLGEAHYRLDNEDAARLSWEAVLKLPETPSTYTAWRNIAAARVRDGDLVRAIDAYREADRRAPQADKTEIATRLGWLTKETGNTRASGRYFARGRGDARRITLTILIIAVTSIVSLTALFSNEGEALLEALVLDKIGIAMGEYWRLWSVTLLHADIIHLGFNMYALYLAGAIVERWYGWLRYLVFYLACAAAASTASFVFGPGNYAVGASGAIFGLFGILFAASRLHHPVDRESRGLMSRLGFLVLVNIAFGFASGGEIDNAAHLGGLAAGLWLGALLPPTGVPTLSSLWNRPGTVASTTSGLPATNGRPAAPGTAVAGKTTAPGYLLLIGLAVIAILVVAGLSIGTSARVGSTGDRVPAARVASVTWVDARAGTRA
jgi:membrane associated rhomboid family serine protease